MPWEQQRSAKEGIKALVDDKFKMSVQKSKLSAQWLLDSDVNPIDGTFVNLQDNTESFTGYQSPEIWRAIYKENCFQNKNNTCYEESIFYKVISGLHTNINIHLSANNYDANTNTTYLNKSMLQDRVLNYPDRVNNLFSLYSMLVRAFDKSENLLRNFEIQSGNDKSDSQAKITLDQIYQSDAFKKLANTFTDDYDLKKISNFDRKDELVLKFRNISLLIDCVSCEKCKLHGKLQMFGLATMLKILLDKNYANSQGKNVHLELVRNEVVAFVNLFGKVAKSVHILSQSFRWNSNYWNIKFILVSTLTILFMNYFFIRREKKNNRRS